MIIHTEGTFANFKRRATAFWRAENNRKRRMRISDEFWKWPTP